MPWNTTVANRLCLAGDWTIGGVAEQFPLLAQYIARLADTQSSEELQQYAEQGLPEMDLAGITELDACGCQLLGQFFLALQQYGFSPRVGNIPDALIPKVGLLGFNREFNISL